MLRLLLFSAFLFVYSFSISQEIERVQITGKISAPLGDDIEGISIYNTSSQKGTITTPTGEFVIDVVLNDHLIITALQFQKFTVLVDKGVIETKSISIYLNPKVNELEEVIIRPFNLSGDIIADVKRIKVVDFDTKMDLSYEAMEYDYDFRDDAQTSIRGNRAEEAYGIKNLEYGVNFVAIFRMFFQKKDKKRNFQRNNQFQEDKIKFLIEKYGFSFYTETYKIPSEKVYDFLYFVDSNGLTSNLLQAYNEIELLEFLAKQSILYKNKSDKN